MENNIYLEKIAAEQKGYGAAEVGGLVAGGVAGKALMDKARAKSLLPLTQKADQATNVASKASAAMKSAVNPAAGLDQSARYKQLAGRAANVHGMKDKVTGALTKAKSATKHMGTLSAVSGAVVGFDLVNSLRNKMSKKD